ncbi:MAG TPA: ChbG/HpnK family deacetylase [Luteolibacter sp.]
MKRLTLCADDFAQSAAISGGILRLVEAGRLNAVSCLSESPRWPRDARALLAVPEQPAIGLHFNLTLPFGQSERRVTPLLAASLLGGIDRGWVLRRFDAQWRAFVETAGRVPDFVDGHQHVHAFPGVREGVIERLAELAPGCRVRSLAPPPGLPRPPLKERVLAAVARDLPGRLAEAGLRTNRGFAGFRPYRGEFAFGETFRRWLAVCPDDTLVMCHPGLPADDPRDPIARCRPGEFDYLMSDAFVADLLEAGVVLATCR